MVIFFLAAIGGISRCDWPPLALRSAANRNTIGGLWQREMPASLTGIVTVSLLMCYKIRLAKASNGKLWKMPVKQLGMI